MDLDLMIPEVILHELSDSDGKWVNNLTDNDNCDDKTNSPNSGTHQESMIPEEAQTNNTNFINAAQALSIHKFFAETKTLVDKLVSMKKKKNLCNVCTYCLKKFEDQEELQAHRATHTEERRYSCPDCPKKFTQKCNQLAHMRIHTGEKPYMCPHCFKTFTQVSGLQRHVRTHTGDKPHLCPYCKKGFTNTSSLQVHVRIHTGEKPYKCRLCPKSFAKCSNRKSHMRTHRLELGL